MGNVYSLDAERNLILYRSGTALYIRSTSGESVTRPVTLCTDYKDTLSDTTYNGTVYYAYRSTEQDIIVRSITDLQNIYRISSQEVPDCRDPRLITFRENLILFYTTKSPLNNAFYLKAVFPLRPEKRISLPETAFTGAINLGILVMSDQLILSVISSEKRLLCALNAALEPTLYPPDSPALESRLDTTSKQLQDTQQRLNTTLEDLHRTQQELDAASGMLQDTQQKLNTTTEQFHNAQKKLDAALEQHTYTKKALENAQILVQELNAKNTKLESDLHTQAQTHNETIESICTQYNDLMNTATRYREEAARWHDIAYKKNTKPIPGESLLADNW